MSENADPRASAIATAHAYFDDGAFIDDLARLVEVPTVSQDPEAMPFLHRYLKEMIAPYLSEDGFSCKFFDNPEPDGTPLMIAERHEDDSLPTVLVYGHGDVVPGQENKWRDGLGPWKPVVEEDRIYGRGTADNKGQHWINFTALRTVLRAKGKLGFNCKILMEMGEERGSYGLRAFCEIHKERLAADVLIASDGPRLNSATPTVMLGSRGSQNIALSVKLRDGAFHSGNWGGIIKDPGILLTQAIASITDKRGQIRIPEWRPTSLTDKVRAALANCPVTSEGEPQIDPDWGEVDLSVSERLFGWNSFAVLALDHGDIDKPVNAIYPSSRAIVQLRTVVGTDHEDIMPALRRHLDREGFPEVEIEPARKSSMVATRSDADDPWVRRAAKSVASATGKEPVVLPNIGGSIPNDLFANLIGMPTIWLPHSYAACAQHGPNEHLLGSVAREALGMMTGVFWDAGEAA